MEKLVVLPKEHRSLMETAYAYGSIYQFVLTPAGPVLKYLGYVLFSPQKTEMNCNCRNRNCIFSVWLCFSTESPDRSQVWFLHCQDHEESTNALASDRCPFTRMSKPITTLHLHSFLQLMHDPLVVSQDPLLKRKLKFYPPS